VPLIGVLYYMQLDYLESTHEVSIDRIVQRKTQLTRDMMMMTMESGRSEVWPRAKKKMSYVWRELCSRRTRRLLQMII